MFDPVRIVCFILIVIIFKFLWSKRFDFSNGYKKKNSINKALWASFPTTINGITRWRLPNGNYHRKDGPACITDNYASWYNDGCLHREDGPAIEAYGRYTWYINDKKLDPQPVLVKLSKNKLWEFRKNGDLHRIDGPAVIAVNNLGAVVRKEWWVDGHYTKS